MRGLYHLGIAALVAIPGGAFAQDARQDEDEIIVTAQQAQRQVVSDGAIGVLGNLDALETPFNVTGYTAQLILDQQSETIGDVLENEPSVRTTYGFGNQAELFVLRGFTLSGDDVSIDGLYGVTPRQLVSPELYERVQVLNGANAFLFGAAPGGSGIGGSINLVPKRAERTLLRATASYGADSLFGGNFDAGTRFGRDNMLGLRVNGIYREGETAVDNDRRRVGVLGGSFDVRTGPGRFFLDIGYEDQNAYQPRTTVRLAAGQPVPDAPDPSYNPAQRWTYTELRDLYVLARAEVDVAPNITAFLAAGMRNGTEEGEYSTITVTNAATGIGTAARLYVPREDHNQSGQAGLRGRFQTGPISHRFSLGASVNFLENRNAFTSGNFPLAARQGCAAAPVAVTSFCTSIYDARMVDLPTNATLPSAGGDLVDLPRASTAEFTSFYASDTLGLWNDRVLVTAGARHQRIGVDAYNRGTLLRTTSYRESATTPVVGLVVRPTERLSLYANRIEGLAQGPTAPLNANTLNAGEVFAPFRSVQYEIGGKIALRGLTGTVALYQITQPSAFSASTPTPTNPNALTFVVDGEQRNRGVEVSLNGEPTDWLRIIGGFALNDAKLTRTLNGINDGRSAIGVPDLQANLGVELVPPFLRAATITARVVHTAAQYLDVANSQRVPAWSRVDLGIRYVLVAADHPVTLRLSAENVTNEGYWASAFGGYLLQGQPRTLRSSVTFEF
ncbi:TonB-dependent siderophore receptor [Sphingosinicella sp. BN140058]|uniref:TonB-dependent receptor n=1 Tax=Sphingosinicella sp. BN140058 TaxID=1892855 RepID=UPI00101134D2|nr:TonB-dependent siderophore receptor [Sphingosinicella sp. BN140058]QAY76324.1 TonB-dependent siderophore receptor [Sphingosinicella sp. BN140058]